MKLQQVEIVNFRSIKSLTQVFTPTCKILVGLNESGKSNILHALRLLSNAYSPAPDDVREPAADEDPVEEAFVEFHFALDDREQTSIAAGVQKALLCKNHNRPLCAERAIKLTSTEVCKRVARGALYKVNLLDKSKRARYWCYDGDIVAAEGWMSVADSCPKNIMVLTGDQKTVALATFAFVNVLDFPDVPPSYLEQFNSERFVELVGRNICSWTVANLPPVIFWEYTDKNLLPGRINIDAFAARPESCIPLQNMFTLAKYDDVANAISEANERSKGLHNLLKRVAKRTTAHIHGVWKEYKGISIYLDQNGDDIEAGVQDDATENVFNFERRSDGFKRFITFLLLVSAKERTDQLANAVILIDEPDICLHPSGARLLRDELIKISRSNLVVFSTHSIFMIDRDNIPRHSIVRKQKEITTVVTANDSNIYDEEVIMNALGASVFESLSQKNIIFEGWYDKLLFRAALKRRGPEVEVVNTFRNFGTCHAEGNKDIPRVSATLDLANRYFVIISDDDRCAIEQQRKYHGPGNWYRYSDLLGQGEMTSEDFLDEDYIKQVIRQLVQTYGTLSGCSADPFSGNRMRLFEIKNWLTRGGLTSDQSMRFIAELKERCFMNLAPRHISVTYFTMLQKLLERMESEHAISS